MRFHVANFTRSHGAIVSAPGKPASSKGAVSSGATFDRGRFLTVRLTEKKGSVPLGVGPAGSALRLGARLNNTAEAHTAVRTSAV